MNQRALIIEDDDQVVAMLTPEIEELGYVLEHAADGERGLQMALEHEYAFVLLDLKLPKLGGIEICRKLRAENANVPIIMLTSRTSEANKVLLLEIGADDYITKPCSLLELRARITAVVRRSARTTNAEGATTKKLRIGELSIDFEMRRVVVEGTQVELTATEYTVLVTLAARPGRPFTRSELLESIFGNYVEGYDKNISNHINRLRRKIEKDPENPRYVVTVRGVGYCLKDE